MTPVIGAGVLALAAGIAVLICCLANVDDFFEFRQAAVVEDWFGRTGARIFYGIWGTLLCCLGTFLLIVVLLKSNGLLQPPAPPTFAERQGQEMARKKKALDEHANRYLARKATELPAGFTIRLPNNFSKLQVTQTGSKDLWRVEHRWSDADQRNTILAAVYGGPRLKQVPPNHYLSGPLCNAVVRSAGERIFGKLEDDAYISRELLKNTSPDPSVGSTSVFTSRNGKRSNAELLVIPSAPYLVVLIAERSRVQDQLPLSVSMRSLDTSKVRPNEPFDENAPGQQNLWTPVDVLIFRQLSGDSVP